MIPTRVQVVVIFVLCFVLVGCATTRTVVVQDSGGRGIPGALVYLTDANKPFARNEPQLSRTNAAGETPVKSFGTIRLQIVEPSQATATETILKSRQVLVVRVNEARSTRVQPLAAEKVSAGKELVDDWTKSIAVANPRKLE